jgi:hypothetical protein
MTLPLVHPAQGVDGQVHVVVANGAVLGSPSGRTLCGRAALVVYEHSVGTTCPECSRELWTTQVPVFYEPCG